MTRKNGKGNPDVVDLAPGLHPDKGWFVTQNGYRLTLRKTNALLIERLINNQAGKPPVPIIEVSAPRGGKRQEENPRDPDYLAALNTWNNEKSVKLMIYLFSEGIEEQPPDDYISGIQQYLDEDNPALYKYLWIGSLLEGEIEDDSSEITDLMTAIMGFVYPTKGGLETAAESFRSDGERLPD